MNTVKVEIRLIDGEWQWLGKLSKKSLKALCDIADALCDADMEDVNK